MDTETEPASKGFFVLRPYDSYGGEILVLLFVAIIAIVAFLGRRKNERLAKEISSSVLRPEGTLQRNFAVVLPELRKVGPDVFQMYATGRRYCLGAEITLRMRRRQDLSALLLGSAQQDVIDIEIAVADGAMPSTVFLVSSLTVNQNIVDTHTEVVDLAKELSPPKDRLPTWPRDDLDVRTEHASIFYDVFGSIGSLENSIFHLKDFEDTKDYFRYLLATSDYEVGGQRRQMIRASVVAPSGPGAGDLVDRLIATLCFVVDRLASVRLTPEQSKRASEARAKRSEASSETDNKAKRAEQRKAAKEAEEKARLARLPPEQRAKEKARRERIQRERKLRQLMKRA